MNSTLPSRWQEILRREAAENVGNVLAQAQDQPDPRRIPRWTVPALAVGFPHQIVRPQVAMLHKLLELLRGVRAALDAVDLHEKLHWLAQKNDADHAPAIAIAAGLPDGKPRAPLEDMIETRLRTREG